MMLSIGQQNWKCLARPISWECFFLGLIGGELRLLLAPFSTRRKLKAGTQKWRFGSDDFPFQMRVIFGFNMLIFKGLSLVWTLRMCFLVVLCLVLQTAFSCCVPGFQVVYVKVLGHGIERRLSRGDNPHSSGRLPKNPPIFPNPPRSWSSLIRFLPRFLMKPLRRKPKKCSQTILGHCKEQVQTPMCCLFLKFQRDDLNLVWGVWDDGSKKHIDTGNPRNKKFLKPT